MVSNPMTLNCSVNTGSDSILKIWDIIGDDGEMIQFAQFKQKYQVKGNILDYYKLV